MVTVPLGAPDLLKCPWEDNAQIQNSRKPNIGTLFRYIVSGGMAAAAHFATLIVLVEAYGVPATLASGIGFGVAVIVNYSLQYYWTFMARRSHGIVFTRYVLVTMMMLLVNTAVFWALFEPLGFPYLIAQLCATALVVSGNFEMNRRYTFRDDG